MVQTTIERTIMTVVHAERVMEVLEDPRNISRWAPLFADKVTFLEGDQWQVTKNGISFPITVVISQTDLTVGYLRTNAEGEMVGARVQLLREHNGGTSITLDLPLPPAAAREVVSGIILDELIALVELSKTESSTEED